MKQYIVELDDDNFKIFEAPNDIEADIIGYIIAQDYGSDFCEVNRYEE